MATDLGDIFRERATGQAAPASAPAPTQQASAETPTAPQPSEQPAVAASVAEQPKGETEPAQAETAGEEQAEGRTRDEKGRYVPLPALQEERTRRQEEQKARRELETQLAQLQGRLEALQQFVPAQAQQQQGKPPAEADSDEFYRDPVAWSKGQMAQELQQAGVVFARSMHSDYDEVVTALDKASTKAPWLTAQVMAQPPAQRAMTAYQLGKQYMKAASYESIEDMERKIREDERAKTTEELRKQYALAAADQVPKTVAGARGIGAETKPVWSGPKPLDKVFPGY